MAQRYFEVQAVRRRLGPVATGEPFEVRLTAGGALAYVSLANGGAQVAGSIVLTDPAQGSLKFWGPTDDTDTLYVRSVNDESLGWQRVTADPDVRLDQIEANGGPAKLGATNTFTGDTFLAKTRVGPYAGSNASASGLGAFGHSEFQNDLYVGGTLWPLGVSRFLGHSYFKSGRPWVALRAFGSGTGTSADMQDAINYAQTLVDSNTTEAPIILVDPGSYHWTTSITLKSAAIVCLAGPNVGARVYWDGAAGATVMTKSASFAGGTAFGGIEGIAFIPGTAEPGCWLDLTANAVDFGYRLKELELVGGTVAAIKGSGWVNAHWEHLRFDGQSGFAIQWTPAAGNNLGTFVLDGFTFDNNRGSLGGSGCEGMIFIDLSANPSNVGTFVLRNGRIEINTLLTGRKGIVVVKVPNSGANARSLGLAVEDITVDEVIGTAGDCLLYHDTTATNLHPSLVLKNFRQSGLSAIVGGSLSANYPPIPVQTSYGYLAFAQGNNEMMAGMLRLLATNFGGDVAAAVRRGAEAQDRLQIGADGKLLWGSGSAVGDTNLYRVDVDALGTDDRMYVASLGVGNFAAATTPGSVVRKIQVFSSVDGSSLGFLPVYSSIT